MGNLLKEMGTRIYNRRKGLGFTQEELAERAGLTPQNVSTAELGKKALRPENIIKICGALGVSTDYLLLGVVAPGDYRTLSEKISRLSPEQFRCLEGMIDLYIRALSGNGSEE